jgi:primosomal protein N' (replication factor Y)
VLPGDSSLLGPAPMFRARGRFRRRLLIKSARRGQAIEAVHAELEAMLAERLLRGIVLSVDVDPQ